MSHEREKHPGKLFLAYALWMVAMGVVFWLNRDGNPMVSLVAVFGSLALIRMKAD